MTHDAIVVGSGPNGLAAAITLAREGLKVLLLEGQETVGGGMRTAELTLPGFRHDICSAIHPLGMASPFFRELPLADFGLEWIQPDLPLAHPLDDGTALALHRSLVETVAGLGEDGPAYRRLLGPPVAAWERLAPALLGPFPVPRAPLALARFGLRALPPATWLARVAFRGEGARGLFAGLAAHSMMPLERPITSSFGLMLAILAHVVGWPLPRGGSQSLADAMAAYLRALGGEVETGQMVGSLSELPSARAILLDVSVAGLLRLAGDQLPAGYRRGLLHYRYGPGVCKIDYALAGPIPWTAEAPRRAGTVHLGGTLAEIARSERAVWRGQSPERPYVLLAQQSLFDDTRAPAGQHTVWAYCHVPHGSPVDMSATIEAQIERFAPGFRDLILARHTMTAPDYARYNPNYVGGDINSGVQDLGQLWTRPVARRDPYATPLPGVYLCSSATPPGGGVHGMAGYHAARSALRSMWGDSPESP